MKPFFSIIIPTLNEEEFLPCLLGNLTNQNNKDFEIIIIDSHSEDKTVIVAQKFNTLPIRIYNVDKRNVSHQRNYGANKAKGDYLIFIDADSKINKNFIKQLKKIILKKNGLVFIPSISSQVNNPEIKIFFKLVNFIIDLSQSTTKPLSTGGSMIWEKNFFKLVGGFNTKLFIAEDHHIIQKAQKCGVRARFLKKVKFFVSLRRLKREGRLSVLNKYLLATTHLFTKGDITNKLFEYQMGGAVYNEYQKTSNLDEKIKKYFSQIKKFVKKNFTEI